MNKTEKDKLCAKLDWEGGMDTFITYSDFPEIKDKEFRRLLDAYVKAYQALSKYIGWDVYEE